MAVPLPQLDVMLNVTSRATSATYNMPAASVKCSVSSPKQCKFSNEKYCTIAMINKIIISNILLLSLQASYNTSRLKLQTF